MYTRSTLWNEYYMLCTRTNWTFVLIYSTHYLIIYLCFAWKQIGVCVVFCFNISTLAFAYPKTISPSIYKDHFALTDQWEWDEWGRKICGWGDKCLDKSLPHISVSCLQKIFLMCRKLKFYSSIELYFFFLRRHLDRITCISNNPEKISTISFCYYFLFRL